jgi:hypothetical protein
MCAPPAPILVRVVATRPQELDRGIGVEWTQAALDEDLRCEVEDREPDTGAAPFTTAGVIARGTRPVNGRFRFVHAYRVPGRRHEYRVIAVREALDPVGPTSTARRQSGAYSFGEPNRGRDLGVAACFAVRSHRDVGHGYKLSPLGLDQRR